MSDALEAAYHLARDWMRRLSQSPAGVAQAPEAMRARFAGSLPVRGTNPRTVIEQLAESMQGGLQGCGGGRFFAWVVGGALPSSVAADWLVSAWDQNAALFAVAPAATAVEEVTGEWLKTLLGLPPEASFAFTTGCQMAHVTALAAARHALLEEHGWDVEAQGLFGAPRIRVLATCHRHGSVDRALRFLGFGTEALVQVEADPKGGMRMEALRECLADGPGPTVVLLNAGDLNVAAFDDFAQLIPIARDARAWVHVDGAFGLFARASRSKRHLTRGLDEADSWATDAHKWLNVPFDCGFAVVRHSAAHSAAMTQSAGYIAAETGARDPIDWNLEWSRRARSIPVYAALRELGSEGVEDLVNRCCAHCAALVSGLGNLDGAAVVAEPTLNQGLIRFCLPHTTPAEGDLFTERVIRAVNATGEAFFSPTTWDGRRVMRVSVVNWQTGPQDVARAVAAVKGALESTARSSSP